ncbi:uncharacterized protein LOC127746651 [Arachis duranensis]|uniref:Uncharacterized protein LOC127746651 n=1 Tax=Arachis duranensis TaxID=130453 RepID=A0A9C6TM31_ARADU|nr:uncharacterized protein LOC127746651 [Arachis duranensis]
MEENMENHHEKEVHNHARGGPVNHDRQERRVLGSYINPNPAIYGSSILKPTIHANNFELKPQLITLVQNNFSCGVSAQDPNQHLSTFLRICDTVKSNGIHPDIYKLLLFPFSLRDKAAKWLQSFPKDSLTTWEEVVNRFLARFYPPQRINRLRAEVQTFRQQDRETLYEAWERFKDLTRRCPPEMFNEWVKLHIFYEGLSYEVKKAVDHSSGGSLNKKKTIEEAIYVIKTVSENEYFYASERTQKKGVLELNSVDALLALNKAIAAQIAALTNRMEVNQASVIHDQTPQQEGNALESKGDWEQANYVHNSSRTPYDPHSKTYSPRNHRPYHNSQNTSYHNNQPIHNNLNQDTPSSTMQSCKIKSNFERMEAAIAQLSSQISGAVSTVMDRQTQTDRRIDANQEEYRSNMKNQGATISKLEAQVGILSK